MMNQPGLEQSPPPSSPPPPRSSAPLVIAVLAGLVVGSALTAIVMVLVRSPPPPRPVAVTSASAAAPPPSASAVAPPLTLMERAARGERDAVAELEKVPPEERTSEQALALAGARAVDKRKQIAELGRKIKLVEKLGRDRATKKKIEGFAADREVGNDMLATLAGLPGPIGPDLLYTVWTTTRRKTDTTELAKQLLYSKDVRQKASPALAVALDLRAEDDCAKMKKILERAVDKGDRRSVRPIVRLKVKHGCGPKKTKDCWACLRKKTLIKDALKATSRHRSP